MTMREVTRCGLVLLTGALLFPLALAGQEQAKPQPPTKPQDKPTELVFEREVFQYPSFERRNPFMPLVAADQGPRFDQLRLMGIIHSDDPTLSVAVLGTSMVSTSEDGSTVSVGKGKAWYLKVGQSVGNVRIIEIRTDQVVVEVAEYGLTEQKIMQLETRRLGGTP
jgi:hypothetical protein